jgi:glycosyltransferase involved in cell wall biosynthesis
VQDGRTGYLLEPDDEAGLLARICQLMTDEVLRTSLGKSARTFIEQNHALRNLLDILEHFYAAILS